MSKSRSLEKELGITNTVGNIPHEIDTGIIKNKVHSFLSSYETERKITRMKSTKKTAIIAAAVVLVLGISAFAATKLFTVCVWESHSSGIPEYTSVPTLETVRDDVGYDAVIIEEFSNGYKFDNGSIVNNSVKNEENSSIEQFKSVSFRYKKDNDIVDFNQEKLNAETAMTGKNIECFNGITVYSDSYTYKIVPPGYEYTDEDKAAMQSGEIIFSEGSQTVEIHNVKAVTWVVRDMHYNLMQVDGELSESDLLEMAKEIISK